MVEQASDTAGDAGDVRVRRMFGEYALYLGDEVVGLLRRTAAELPESKPKKPKKKRRTGSRELGCVVPVWGVLVRRDPLWPRALT